MNECASVHRRWYQTATSKAFAFENLLKTGTSEKKEKRRGENEIQKGEKRNPKRSESNKWRHSKLIMTTSGAPPWCPRLPSEPFLSAQQLRPKTQSKSCLHCPVRRASLSPHCPSPTPNPVARLYGLRINAPPPLSSLSEIKFSTYAIAFAVAVSSRGTSPSPRGAGWDRSPRWMSHCSIRSPAGTSRSLMITSASRYPILIAGNWRIR